MIAKSNVPSRRSQEGRSESKIQTAIRNKLTKQGWIVIKLIQTSFNGIPDLLCLKDGKAVFIEVKKEGGKASALQLHRHQQLRKAGFECLIIDDEKNLTLS